ncbi:hypothetical protein ACYSNO_00650 [Enterococcus sp. LJL98]
MGYGKEYIDRGIVKWNGMYLSEHLRQLQTVMNDSVHQPKQKRKMTVNERNDVLSKAQLKGLSVAIQKEARNLEGNYLAEVVGKIEGFDHSGLFIDGEKIIFDAIRHVEIRDHPKWSRID